jgi:phosphoglycerate kinase
MQSIDSVPADALKGKRVLVRSDFNLPLNKKGDVADTYRLKRGWETIAFLAGHGARVIAMSHIGRDPEESMEPVARAAQQFGKVTFVPDLTGHVAQAAISSMRDGEVILLENLRRDPRETENDEAFARELAALADIYVDDAFAAAHRAHASIVGVPRFLPHYAGLLVKDELAHLDEARKPVSPSFAILGGAKFETKAPLITTLLANYDHVFIVGALANDVFKAKGYPVGRSLISKELPSAEVLQHPHFLAPVDVTVESEDGQSRVKRPEEVEPGDNIVDVGPDSVAAIAPYITGAKFILWNGPTGMYEKGYVHYTRSIAELIAESSAKKVIGGGDTVAAIEESKVPEEKLGFLSTGGGAMLEYLLKGSLPGIAALE